MRTLSACVMACMTLAVPAQAAPTASRDAQIAAARAALARKDEAEAIALLDRANADFPDDPEILRLLGSAHGFAGHYLQAIVTLRRAQELAPADNDIAAALARAYLWSGDRAAAEREVVAIERRSPGDAEVAAIRRQLLTETSAAQPQRFGLAVAQGFSHVSFDNRPSRTWSTTTLAAYGRVAQGTVLALAAEREDRQSFTDTRIEGRIDQRIGPHIRAYAALAVTPHADFREKWSASGGIEADVTSYATLLGDLRHAEYRDVSVTTFLPGVRLTAVRLGVSATVRMINLWDEQGTHRAGVSGRLDATLNHGATLYAGAATYPDTEAGITRQVHSLFLGGTVPLAERITLRAGLDYDRRRATYTRKGGSLGLQIGF
ncbi:YaiO family outer membrane beta-barrel protein (plasmid) [Sphingobium sp. SJ10-10]|uniref:YaiO family outer membrane beta-barrel protein n=1 Tax=Sphingobium sp. SJ10-10 TaxID=3114999 RepID=UPI002E18B713|nr:YaiO family outer membrane beta-barrel protein [Sphingobium sp. SJ10-10]